MNSAISGKAPSTHNHDSIYAKFSHSHAISDIINLQNALDSKAPSNHAHDYLPLSGGNISGNIYFYGKTTGYSGIYGTIADTDFWRVQGGANHIDDGYLEIATADGGNEPIMVRQYKYDNEISFGILARTAYLLDANGNTSFPGSISESGTALSDKYAPKSHSHSQYLLQSGYGSVEFYMPSPYGGFIDFHYNNSSSDFTSRIIEQNAAGRLTLNDMPVYMGHSDRVIACQSWGPNGDEMWAW